MNPFSRMLMPALLCLALASLLLPPLWSGTASYLLYPDAQEQTYAWWQHLARGWHAGYLPLWDAHIYSGRSFAGEMQAAVFYPLNWIWLLAFSTPDGSMPILAIESLIALHFLIACLGMWALLRHWQLGQVAAAVGAICFALLGPVAERAPGQANILAGLSWIPLAVLFASLHASSGRRRWAIAAGAVIALQCLAGHVQPAFHAALLAGLLCLFHHLRSEPGWRSAGIATLRSGAWMIVSIIVLALPQWWLTFEYLSDAYRWVGAERPMDPGEAAPYAIFSTHFIVEPAGFLSLLDPWRVRSDDANNLYLGGVGLLLAIFGATWPREHLPPPLRPQRRWLIVLALLAGVAVMGASTPLPRLLYLMPIVRDIRELGRHVILIQFVLCLLAALGAERLLRRTPPVATGSSAALAIAILGSSILWVAHLSALSAQAWQALAWGFAALTLGCVAAVPRTAIAAGLLAGLLHTAWNYRPLHMPHVHDMTPVSAAFAPLEILAPVEREYGRTRLFIDDSVGLRRNYADAHRLQVPLGHSATMYRPYFDFLAQDWTIEGKVYDLLNIRYVLTRKPLDFPLLAEDQTLDLKLYRRPHAYPRVFAENVASASDAERTSEQGFELLHYDDHRIEFSVALEETGRIVVSEIAYPGWCATRDGQPLAIDTAIIGGMQTPLMALALPAGAHRIELRYRPFAFRFGLCTP